MLVVWSVLLFRFSKMALYTKSENWKTGYATQDENFTMFAYSMNPISRIIGKKKVAFAQRILPEIDGLHIRKQELKRVGSSC